MYIHTVLYMYILNEMYFKHSPTLTSCTDRATTTTKHYHFSNHPLASPLPPSSLLPLLPLPPNLCRIFLRWQKSRPRSSWNMKSLTLLGSRGPGCFSM